MIGSMAALPLPPGPDEAPDSALYTDPLQAELLERWGIEVPVIPWPAPPARLIRISAQVYNRFEQYQLLAGALKALLAEAPVKPPLRPATA
jgi:isopenicillin-N epimerase